MNSIQEKFIHKYIPNHFCAKCHFFNWKVFEIFDSLSRANIFLSFLTYGTFYYNSFSTCFVNWTDNLSELITFLTTLSSALKSALKKIKIAFDVSNFYSNLFERKNVSALVMNIFQSSKYLIKFQPISLPLNMRMFYKRYEIVIWCHNRVKSRWSEGPSAR